MIDFIKSMGGCRNRVFYPFFVTSSGLPSRPVCIHPLSAIAYAELPVMVMSRMGGWSFHYPNIRLRPHGFRATTSTAAAGALTPPALPAPRCRGDLPCQPVPASPPRAAICHFPSGVPLRPPRALTPRRRSQLRTPRPGEARRGEARPGPCPAQPRSAAWRRTRPRRAPRGTCALCAASARPQRGAAAAGPPLSPPRFAQVAPWFTSPTPARPGTIFPLPPPAAGGGEPPRPAHPAKGRGLGEPACHSAAAPRAGWSPALSVSSGAAPAPCCHGAVRSWGSSRRRRCRCCRRRGSPGGERFPGLVARSPGAGGSALAMATSTTGSTLLQPLSNAVRLPVDQVRMGRRPPRRCFPGARRGGAAPRRPSAPAPLRAVPPRPIPPAAPPSSPPPPGGGSWGRSGAGGAGSARRRRFSSGSGGWGKREGGRGRTGAGRCDRAPRAGALVPLPARRSSSAAASRAGPGPVRGRGGGGRGRAEEGGIGGRAAAAPGWPTCWHPPLDRCGRHSWEGKGPVSARQCKGWAIIANAKSSALWLRASARGFLNAALNNDARCT